MQLVNMHEARNSLAQLIERAVHGEDIVLCRAGKPVVRLLPFAPGTKKPRQPGLWKGRVHIAPDFDELPPSFVAYFSEKA
jgi:prevent-host-death family protein